MRNGEDCNPSFFVVFEKNGFFHILIVFWDFLCPYPSLRVRTGLKRCRKEFSTKSSISIVKKLAFSNWSAFHNGRGSMIENQYFASNLVESCHPKKMNSDSESPWNSASFDILLKIEKDWYDILVQTTMCKNHHKIIGNHVKS